VNNYIVFKVKVHFMIDYKNQSGLYLVTLNNEEFISVNANDPRRAKTSIKVNRSNCKFGKAKDLQNREKNYWKVFREQNVNFIPLALMTEIDMAEKMVLKELNKYRVKGRTGMKNEWLENIDYIEVINIAYNILIERKLTFKII